MNRFLSLNRIKITSFGHFFSAVESRIAVCFSQFFRTRTVYLNTSKQERGEKMIHTTLDCACAVWCTERRICGWYYWLRSSLSNVVIFSSAYARPVYRRYISCFRLVQFLKTGISQGSVATPFWYDRTCNDLFIANFLSSVPVKEF